MSQSRKLGHNTRGKIVDMFIFLIRAEIGAKSFMYLGSNCYDRVRTFAKLNFYIMFFLCLCSIWILLVLFNVLMGSMNKLDPFTVGGSGIPYCWCMATELDITSYNNVNWHLLWRPAEKIQFSEANFFICHNKVDVLTFSCFLIFIITFRNKDSYGNLRALSQVFRYFFDYLSFVAEFVPPTCQKSDIEFFCGWMVSAAAVAIFHI